MDWLTLLRLQWDRAAALAAMVIGACLLYAGWRGVSDSPFAAEQIPYVVSGGLGGLFALGVAATLWISADLRDEWRKLDRLEQQRGALPGVSDEPRATELTEVVSAPGKPTNATAALAVNGTATPQRTRQLRAR